jgi:cyanophycinase
MTGYLVLEGGAEFGGRMAEPDRRAIALAGGFDATISIIPTAAAPDHNHLRAGTNGVNWFRSLGATHVEALPLLDRASANDATIAAKLRQSRLIYMLGGFTGYLGETLAGSESYRAILDAYDAGAVIAGSSAGAMVMCEYYFDPSRRQIAQGLSFVPHTCVLPHHNTFGKGWAQNLAQLLPDAVLLGIDERTGLIDDGSAGRRAGWRVYGQGAVTIYRKGKATTYSTGTEFADPFTNGG